MKRSKFDYGIDLGTTNSALARMELGEPTIRKTDTLKDTLPSCVGFNRKRAVIVGDPAMNALRSDILAAQRAVRNGDEFFHNFFIEFKRTMGTDKFYQSTNMDRGFSSEELSAEVLKKLRSLVIDEEFRSVVITIPAKFTANQKDATLKAAELAGFEHCELLQEPIAAAMAYGLGSASMDGRWLVFDFGGGTFDAALIRAEEGILRVQDTEGDNYLGGKNLDLAAVDELLIPHLTQNFAIESFLEEAEVAEYLRHALKSFLEPARIQLSFSETVNILSDPDDFPEDDDGNEIELDLRLTRQMLYSAERPIFQRAIDICQDLLKRNSLSGSDLDALILVGGPTFSPNLRQMLREQITEKVDSSIDPMTAVARGAALYASTISISETKRSESADLTAVQLLLGYEPTTVETSELVTIHLAEGTPNRSGLQVEIERGDKGWSSGRCSIGGLGEVISVQLEEGKSNFFTVSLYDERGDRVPCDPDQFTILQGTKVGRATLPYHFGIEAKDPDSGKLVFLPLPGLEKNKSYPATGVMNDLKTQKPAGPGVGEILIPIYEGDSNARGTRAIYNEHVYDAVIKGDDLRAFLPAGSSLELTVQLVRDGEITMKAYFPSLDDTLTIPVNTENRQSAKDSGSLYDELKEADYILEKLEDMTEHIDSSRLEKLSDKLIEAENLLDQAPEDYDRRMEVRNRLREVFREIDELEASGSWPALREKLQDTFKRLSRHFEDLRDEMELAIAGRFQAAIEHFEEQIPAVLKTEDKKSAKSLIDEMNKTGYMIDDTVYGVHLYIKMIRDYDSGFDDYSWSDRNRARMLLNQGLGMAANEPTRQGLIGVLREIFDLLPDDDSIKTNHPEITQGTSS